MGKRSRKGRRHDTTPFFWKYHKYRQLYVHQARLHIIAKTYLIEKRRYLVHRLHLAWIERTTTETQHPAENGIVSAMARRIFRDVIQTEVTCIIRPTARVEN